MTISQKLTDIYYLFDKYQRDFDPIYEDSFKNYLLDQATAEDFVKCIFTIGHEVRDQPLNSFEDHVEHLLNIIQEVSEKYKEDINNDSVLQSIYNLGIINIYLYFCKQSELSAAPTSSLSIDPNLLTNEFFEFKKAPSTVQNRSLNTLKNVKQSVSYLKKALILASETLDISTGIYNYHTIRCLNYIYSAFEYYKVENNNIPVDLDSFYVFSDQLTDNSPLWTELEKQIKNKYNL